MSVLSECPYKITPSHSPKLTAKVVPDSQLGWYVVEVACGGIPKYKPIVRRGLTSVVRLINIFRDKSILSFNIYTERGQVDKIISHCYGPWKGVSYDTEVSRTMHVVKLSFPSDLPVDMEGPLGSKYWEPSRS